MKAGRGCTGPFPCGLWECRKYPARTTTPTHPLPPLPFFHRLRTTHPPSFTRPACKPHPNPLSTHHSYLPHTARMCMPAQAVLAPLSRRLPFLCTSFRPQPAPSTHAQGVPFLSFFLSLRFDTPWGWPTIRLQPITDCACTARSRRVHPCATAPPPFAPPQCSSRPVSSCRTPTPTDCAVMLPQRCRLVPACPFSQPPSRPACAWSSRSSVSLHAACLKPLCHSLTNCNSPD